MTSNERPADRWERLRPRNWSLAFKLIAVLIVPVLMAQGLLVLRIVEQINDAQRLGGNERLVALQDRFSGVIGQLQRERDDSAAFVAGNRTGDMSALKTGFGAVDGSLNDVRGAVGDPSSMGEVPSEAYAEAQRALAKLPDLRTQVTGSTATAAAIVADYTTVIAPVLQLNSALGRQLEQAAPSSLPNGLDGLAAAREQLGQQNALVTAVIIKKSLPSVDVEPIRVADLRFDDAVGQARGSLDGEAQDKYLAFVAGQPNTQRKQLLQQILAKAGSTNPKNEPIVDRAQWSGAYEGLLNELNGSDKGLRDQVSAMNVVQQDDAKNLAGIFSVILLLASVIGTTLLVLVWRTLLRSLRTLRGTALDVAQRRLPEALQHMREGGALDLSVEPVPVTTREEIGQVARAFDAVHSQAVRLAAEQATLQAGVSSMFVNLSRRSQGLVERQLQLIEHLESNEQDPDQLANLFQLDHLATRMRRNSESLLVLAGSDSSRRSSQPVPVIDVLRAAVSEVEQYQRIVVQPPPPVKILGRTAADLVHLLAELLDNATNFSAPDTQVVMSSTRTEDGSVLIEIADRGVGMAAAELTEANDRLSGPSQVDVSASRRMGLFVVGRLASRHGIGVRLGGPTAGASAAGVTASVSVPSYLVPVVEGAVIDDSARVGNGVARQQGPEPVGNGRVGTLSALVASGNSMAGPPPTGLSNGGNGNGTSVRPDQDRPPAQLPPPRGPVDRPLAPPRLAPPLAPRSNDPGRAAPPWGPGPQGAPQGPPMPVAGQVTETRPANPMRPMDPQAHQIVAGPPPAVTAEPVVRPPIAPAAYEPPPMRTTAPSGPPQDRSLPPLSGTLFAASVPSVAEPEAAPQAPPPPPPSRRPTATAAVNERRDLSETTPIFQEIASAWFQSGQQVPVDDWAAVAEGRVATAEPTEAEATEEQQAEVQLAQAHPRVSLEPPIMPAATASPVQQDERQDAEIRQTEPEPVAEAYPAPEEPAAAEPEPTFSPASTGYAQAPHQAPAPDLIAEQLAEHRDRAAIIVQRAAAQHPQPAAAAAPSMASSGEFAGPADQGWLAAQSLAAPVSNEPEELTAAGLPKRRPKARLVPGSAAPGDVPAPVGAPARTADAVRGRLASYQEGVRQGREQRLRRGPEAAGATAGRLSEGHDEENR